MTGGPRHHCLDLVNPGRGYSGPSTTLASFSKISRAGRSGRLLGYPPMQNCVEALSLCEWRLSEEWEDTYSSSARDGGCGLIGAWSQRTTPSCSTADSSSHNPLQKEEQQRTITISRARSNRTHSAAYVGNIYCVNKVRQMRMNLRLEREGVDAM